MNMGKYALKRTSNCQLKSAGVHDEAVSWLEGKYPSVMSQGRIRKRGPKGKVIACKACQKIFGPEATPTC